MKTAGQAVIVGLGMTLGGCLLAPGLLGQEPLRQAEQLRPLEALRLAHNEFGGLALEEENYLVAERLFRRAIRDAEALGVRDADYGTSVFGLARSLEKQGNYVGALPYYLLAKDLYERFSGPKSADFREVERNLATLYESLGDPAESERVSSEAVAREVQQLERQVARYFANEQYALAEEACVKVIAAARKLAGDSKKAKELEARLKVIQTALEVAPNVDAWIRTLEETPQEPEASQKLGRFLCFVRQDWENGFQILRHSDHKELCEAAVKDLRESADKDRRDAAMRERRAAAENDRREGQALELREVAERQLYLADLWSNFAHSVAANPAERMAMEGRALKWYQAALGGLPAGMDKVKTVRRIRELSAQEEPVKR